MEGILSIDNNSEEEPLVSMDEEDDTSLDDIFGSDK